MELRNRAEHIGFQRSVSEDTRTRRYKMTEIYLPTGKKWNRRAKSEECRQLWRVKVDKILSGVEWSEVNNLDRSFCLRCQSLHHGSHVVYLIVSRSCLHIHFYDQHDCSVFFRSKPSFSFVDTTLASPSKQILCLKFENFNKYFLLGVRINYNLRFKMLLSRYLYKNR